MVCFPNCKINLGLFVTNKRDDGYHDLETVFYPLHTSPATNERPDKQFTSILNDVLEVVPAKQDPQLYISGLPVTGERNDNLVWKAYKMLAAKFGDKVPPLDVYLHKAIPMGAGLGGGSADGAYMLRLLNDYCNLGLSQRALANYALALGSDCPFFIYNTPQYAAGRGELMQPVAVDLSAYHIRVVCPGIHVSTRDAFAQISPRPAPFDLQKIDTLPITEWKHHITNDFESTVFKAHPKFAVIKQQLYDQGAVYASMTGTGSAFYGLFNAL